MRTQVSRFEKLAFGFVPLAVMLSGCGGSNCRWTVTRVAERATLDAREASLRDSSVAAARLYGAKGGIVRGTLEFAMLVDGKLQRLGSTRTDVAGNATLDLKERFKSNPRLVLGKEVRAYFTGINGWCSSEGRAPYHVAAVPIAGSIDPPSSVRTPVTPPVEAITRPLVPKAPAVPMPAPNSASLAPSTCLNLPVAVCLPRAA